MGKLFYYKMQQILQSVTFLKNASVQSTSFKFELIDWSKASWNKNQFPLLKRSHNLNGIYWIPFYMMKNADCSWEKDFVWIIKSIRTIQIYIYFLRQMRITWQKRRQQRKGEASPSFSLETKKCPYLGKDAPILFIYELNFPFKMRLYEYLGKNIWNVSC